MKAGVRELFQWVVNDEIRIPKAPLYEKPHTINPRPGQKVIITETYTYRPSKVDPKVVREEHTYERSNGQSMKIESPVSSIVWHTC